MDQKQSVSSIAGIALRDLDRLSAVAVIAARHGFGALLLRTPLGRLLDGLPAGDAALGALGAPQRFAKLLAALGPTFIKLGQILASRKDLLPADWTRALETLQDDAPRLPFDAIREQVEAGLGGRIDELFADFEREPLGTASIGQSHRARTPDGAEVVVKVQRPNIERTVRADLNLLHLAAQLLESGIDELRLLGLVAIVEEFENGLLRELDFHEELANLREFRRNLDPARQVTVPAPYPELSARTVLTMQFFPGRPIRKLEPGSPQARAAVEELMRAVFRQVLVDGVFHGDPHAGNLLVDDQGTVCMIDLGLVGRITPEQRDALVTLAIATIANDDTTIARVLLKMGTPTQRVDLGGFKADIGRIRAKYLTVTSLGAADTTGFIEEFAALAGRHRIQLARDMAIFAKAAATLEGIVRHLHPEADLIALARPFLDEIVRRRLSPQRVLGEMLGEAGGIASMLRTVPAQLDQLLHDFETGNLQVRAVSTALDDLPQRVHALGSRLALAAFAAATTIAAALVVPASGISLPQTVVAALLATASAMAWGALLASHWLARGKPLRLAPLLRFFRR